MGYRIVYGPEPKFRSHKTKENTRLRILVAGCLLLFAISVKLLWPEGTEKLRRTLLPGEMSQTEQAFSSMLENVREGEPLGEAFTAFCRQVIEDGQAEVH